MSTIIVPLFDPKTQIQLKQNIGIFGPRKSGKTHIAAQICRDLEAQHRNIRFIVVGKRVDIELYPESAIILTKWDEYEIKELFETHQKMWKHIDGLELYFVLEDVSPVQYRKSRMLNKIMENGWSNHCTFICVHKDVQRIPYVMASNLDWVICSHYPISIDQQAIFHEFFHSELSRHDFQKLYRKITAELWFKESKHQFLVTNLTDEIPVYHYYKCPLIKKQTSKSKTKPETVTKDSKEHFEVQIV